MTDLTTEFWHAVSGSGLVVLTDFDYTISEVDVGDLVTDTLSPPSAETLRRFRHKEVGTRAFWLDSMIRIEPAAGITLADGVGIDPGFPAFAAWCRKEQIPLAVVSDGFGFYIRHILDREGLSDLPVFCNEMQAKGELQFPHGNPACDFCGCCKAAIARRVRQAGARIIYIGDGVSDLYAAAFADWVFAKATLASFLAQKGAPFYPLTAFDQVRSEIAADLTAFRNGTAKRRVSMLPDPQCRF